MKKILVLCLNPALDLSLLLPALTLGKVNRAAQSRLDAAGKGFNVACVLATLGHHVTLAGYLGADNAEPFQIALIRAGVHDALTRVPGSTRTNAKIAEADGRITDINGRGVTITPDRWQMLCEHLANLREKPEVLIVSGSLPPGVSAATQAELIRQIQSFDVPVWLDSSGSALHEGIAAAPYLIKPNVDELSEWAGHPLSDTPTRIAAADAAIAQGVSEVLLSLGGEGSIWRTREETWSALPPSVKVISTVGAGDTMLAATLHGALKRWTRRETLRYATALSAECVRHIGVGNPNAEDFQELYDQTLVAEGTDPQASPPTPS
ncbi:MAG: 1-phosphofructokinase family hexose kinase [Xanthomonadaceae bacterium]|jgi:1-phosphofructokinase|nr:1-phosphofructokinase family hexose kinase [Xanthomonadaceae bacterium]